MGYQLALRTAGGTFTPGRAHLGNLYAWRVPGFDINGKRLHRRAVRRSRKYGCQRRPERQRRGRLELTGR
jgi:hypothetical protein